MTVYRWEESEYFWVAIVRPDELFDLSTLTPLPSMEEWDDPDVSGSPEGMLKARHIDGYMGVYAYFFDKRIGRDFVDRTIASDAGYIRFR